MSSTAAMVDTTFSKLTDDIILQISFKLEDDPRNWARLSCVCTKFHSLITSICCKSKCISSFHSLSSDLLSLSSGNWASLYKIAVCCPGLFHAGILLENSDFGLYRELGPTHHYLQPENTHDDIRSSSKSVEVGFVEGRTSTKHNNKDNSHELCGWSLYDDLYYDTVYDNSETSTPMENTTGMATLDSNFVERPTNTAAGRVRRIMRSHLASGGWSLSREQGNKLLGSRFRDDCLYVSEWPGCVHIEGKRSYRLFRGILTTLKRL